ncbi:HDIG domain-containing metalloprotein [Pyramidobacter sp. CG50-2]|uniref:HDIG domain-containing metalloprotein n=1 Tax=Pyramidobacter sp. CG50-2 TaxID=2382160 RepID=UPI001F481B87|nr:HDIG domain-containing metalloprotein [Pyramidobacter sp. CG50-2]
MLLGWLFQIGVIYWGVNGVGVFPVIAMIYLTLPDIGALNCAVAVTLSASIITSGYDVTAFAINAISGCAGAILGISLFKRNYSRSAVWIHVFVLGIAMLGVASVLQWGLTNLMSVRQAAIMFTACLLLSFMVIVLLPLLEILFDIVSPLQLVELTQPSHPLLKRMQVEAPGTYHHSQMVGNLAEAAAEKIGLNPMLLRAGACFHDIGKLKRPQSFIENQISGINAHDEMSPALSALVILSHVKDGLELADEYRLPSQIKAFIAEHHGTTCLTYFYRKALQAGLKADESQFCYPGPRPQSKETGVLMIADSTEAAARAESANIKGILDLTRLADNVVQSKISTGQLDEVPFTLKDLSDIKAALVSTLRSMYHTRDIKPLKSLPEEQGKETDDAHGSSNIVAVQAKAAAAKES